ncbi:MAG: class I SAM-dependent methyltransferase [Proteobacteria bacterium]|nr:class I SAM-dependent methyltransferase [Pseudomonadota bacterium]
MTDANDANPQNNPAPLFEGTLFLSPHIDYFQNGDDFFVYHNIYGYIIQMSEDLVDFLEFFHDGPKTADEVTAQFEGIFDADTLNNFLSVFRPLACILPDDSFEPKKTHDMYPTLARWITVDQTNPKAIVIYAFDNQTQNSIMKISLDPWESRVWSYIKGDKTVGEIAEIIAGEDGAPIADVELRLTASLELWSHCSVQAVKLSAEAVRNTKNSRFGIPPYLISTMPYEKVTAHVRTRVDEEGNILEVWEEPVRCKPSRLEIIPIDENTLTLDRNCARLSSMLAAPHAVLKNRSYGQAVYDALSHYFPFSGEVCRILEVGGGQGDTAKSFIEHCQKQIPDTQIDYTIFTPDAAQAELLQNVLKSLDNVHIVTGDIEKIAEIFSGQTFDLIYSDEFLANLPSVAVRKMSLGGDDEDEEDEDRPDDGDLKPAHASDNNKITFIGEGDAVQLIFKYKLNLCDAPEDFILNSGSLRLLGNLAKLTTFNTQIFLIEFGEDIKYPVQTLEDGKITYSQHFGILKQAAKKLGFLADSRYWMEELDIDRDLRMFATTRSQFKAMRQLLADHGVELERKPYTEQEFSQILQKAGRSDVVEICCEPAEDRISGLVSHAYKMLRIYKELEF